MIKPAIKIREKIILGRRKIKGKDPEAGTSLKQHECPLGNGVLEGGQGAQCERPMEGIRNS